MTWFEAKIIREAVRAYLKHPKYLLTAQLLLKTKCSWVPYESLKLQECLVMTVLGETLYACYSVTSLLSRSFSNLRHYKKLSRECRTLT